jgi:outer membrane protein assembly factor BamB
MRGISIFVFLCSINLASASDWPQFRGISGSGVSTEKGLPVKWSQKEGITWKVEIPGRGVSSPIVVGDRIYITSNSGYRQDRLHVLCYAAHDGKLLWQRQLTATGNTGCHPLTTMAAPTPVATKDAVYALFATGDVASFDKEGNLLWYRSLTGDYPTIANQVGMASSPVLWKDLLIVPMENSGESFLAGISTKDGKNVWKIERPREINWVTPAIRVKGDKAEVIFQNRVDLTAYDADSGKKLWTYKTEGGSISTPILVDDKVLVPTRGLALIQPEGDQAKQLWKTAKLGNHSATAVYYKDKIYNLSGAVALVCGDPKTGEVFWQQRVKGKYWASPIIADDKAYVFNDAGLATVIQLSETPEELSTNDLGEEILGTPAISDSSLFIRTSKSLYRIGKGQPQ